MVPAVLLFGTARRVNPGQCVAKKPYIRRARRRERRSGKKRERRREGEGGEGEGEEEGRKGEKAGEEDRRNERDGEEQRVQEGKEGDANVHGRVSHAHGHARARMHASTCSRTRIGECVRDGTTTLSIAVMPVCQTGPQPASELRARRAGRLEILRAFLCECRWSRRAINLYPSSRWRIDRPAETHPPGMRLGIRALPRETRGLRTKRTFAFWSVDEASGYNSGDNQNYVSWKCNFAFSERARRPASLARMLARMRR